MTPRDRFDAAFDRAPADRPPIMYQHLGAARTVLRAAGLTMREGYHDPEKFARICTMAQRITGFDNVMAGWGDILVEAHAHGTPWRWPEKDYYPRSDGYAIGSLAQLDQVRSVDPMDDPYWSVPLRAAGLMQERIGEEVAVLGCITGPMMMGGEVMGYEALLMATWAEPDLAEELMGRLLGSSAAYGEHLARMGVGYVFIEDGTCSVDVNSIEGLQRFDLGMLSRMLSAFRSQGLRSIVHNCANNPYLDGYPGMEIDALHFTPKAEERKGLYDRFRKEMTVIGGIDQTVLLFKGSPEDVAREVQGMLADWGDGPGYMVAPGCEMPFKIPMENIIALREAVAGVRPLPRDG
ncbi:MAG TPA: uroporphyrinogen decarboxylase family protein [Methanomassiliicoccales archaeon]|nr:uroporphyrinogen decarboxylase family protein [Methanomassiliicoccales archaeon]